MSGPLPEHALKRLLGDAEPLLAELQPPAQIGKYTIVREVGRGGMGVVYEALDPDLKRRVALKVIAAPALSSETQRARFHREALAVARLNHPNIAAVHDVIDGAIVLQYVDGAPLSALPAQDPRRLVTLIRDAALAVHYAHQHDIVHRDLKPHNLMVEGERVMVMDFGLAKVTAVGASLSLSGHLLGTPAYMAPEQASGRGHDVDAQTDVYGLGATLYELLTGRPPFADTDLVRLLRRVVEDQPIAPRALRPDLPRDLDTIVRKCLAKEKPQRYASAAALAQDLSRWLEHRPVLARRPSLCYRAAKLVARHRALATVAALGLLAFAFAWSETAKRTAAQNALRSSELWSRPRFTDAQTHLRLGDTEQAQQRVADGIGACRAYLARHDAAHVHFFLGRLLRVSQQRDEARRELDRAADAALHEARSSSCCSPARWP
ncbi:MAG: serine/threonine-protein kinase [Planctomycetota bacterium]